MVDLGLLGENNYWIASRYIGSVSCDTTASIRYIDLQKQNPLVYKDYLTYKAYQGTFTGKSITLGVRVIFHLNSSGDVVVGGNGTKTDPYIIERGTPNQTVDRVDIARIGNTKYKSLNSAIAAAPENTETTIVLLENTTENIDVPEDKIIIIDLNNKTIINQTAIRTITIYGTLSLTNGTVTGTANKKLATINVKPNAVLNLSNVLIESSSTGEDTNETIAVGGTLNIDSGRIISINSNAITMSGSASRLNISGTAEIVGNSTKNNMTVYNNYGTITMTGGLISTQNSIAVWNEGAFNMSGTAQLISTATNTTWSALLNDPEGIATITGGSISAPNSQSIINQGGTVYLSSNCTVTGGTSGTITPYTEP